MLLRALAPVACLAAMLAGCATEAPAPVPPPRAAACPSCSEEHRELARLRRELALREAEVRELRARERDQSKALQTSVQESTRAKSRLRRLATQAEAASTMAEVEVALERLRAAPDASMRPALIEVPQRIIDSAAAPFEQGDYDTAMNRAAQAEQLVAMLEQPQTRERSASRGGFVVPFDVSVALRVASDGNLRREPHRTAPVQTVLARGTAVTASAYRGPWLRVATADGHAGWLHRSLIDAP